MKKIKKKFPKSENKYLIYPPACLFVSMDIKCDQVIFSGKKSINFDK